MPVSQGAAFEANAADRGGSVVFKIGGSLLDLPDLADRIERLLAQRPAARPLMVIGGGAAADVVRRWDQTHRLGDERAHWLAIDAMALTAALVGSLMPQAVLVEDIPEWSAACLAGGIPVLDARRFLRRIPQDALPFSWDVTSDSIAACAAIHWRASELVLVKSIDPPPGDPRRAVSPIAVVVDEHFGKLAASIPRVSWMNLRAEHARIQSW